MNDTKDIQRVVYKVFDELNALLSRNERVEKSLEFRISEELDSLMIINLLVLTEQKIQEDFGVAIVLTDGRIAVNEIKPLLTMKTYIDYVTFLVGEAEDVQR